VTDAELERVYRYLDDQDPMSERFGKVIRATYDQLYDGQRTGRFRWEELLKTEKTHYGTLIEINVHREFWFSDGEVLDYSIEDVEVDCKYSAKLGRWMIPPEAVGRICLVITSSDLTSRFSVGLVRAEERLLRSSANRDAKRTLTPEGVASVRWLHYERPILENLLLHLDDDTRAAILDRFRGPRGGQARVNELFRRVQRRVISRNVVATVAQQDDYMKRVRGNGGARSHLRSEGVVILGDYGAHTSVARVLQIPVPTAGGFVSVRLAPASDDGDPHVVLGGRRWRVARDDDPPVEAPLLPDVRKRADPPG
jgi:hypothetical protein